MFIVLCSLKYSPTFPTERSKITFMITLLTGRALQWAESLWNANSPVTRTFNAFTTHFKEVSGQAVSELSVQDRLFRLSQEKFPYLGMGIFCSILHPRVLSVWNKTVFLIAFLRGLNLHICQLMAIYDGTVGLETLISKAIRASQHLTACEEDMPLSPPLSRTTPAPATEPMHIRFNPLTRIDRERIINSGLCIVGQEVTCSKPVQCVRPVQC